LGADHDRSSYPYLAGRQNYSLFGKIRVMIYFKRSSFRFYWKTIERSWSLVFAYWS
jgi:hypothetical protein